jgi:Protein of unknown function (DUF2752)
MYALRQRHPLLAPAATAAAVTALVAYVGAVDPNQHGHYPTCPFLYLTGLYCPGCGALRMIHALAHGHFGEAFGRNALLFCALPFLAVIFVRWTLRQARGRPRIITADPRLLWALFAVIITFWVLRNIPYFHVLAPT